MGSTSFDSLRELGRPWPSPDESAESPAAALVVLAFTTDLRPRVAHPLPRKMEERPAFARISVFRARAAGEGTFHREAPCRSPRHVAEPATLFAACAVAVAELFAALTTVTPADAVADLEEGGDPWRNHALRNSPW